MPSGRSANGEQGHVCRQDRSRGAAGAGGRDKWGVALSPALDRPVETLIARWAPPPSQFVPLQGMQEHLRDEGPRTESQPIVLLHSTSARLHTWDGWSDALWCREIALAHMMSAMKNGAPQGAVVTSA